jgi:rod shape determining protein RodA
MRDQEALVTKWKDQVYWILLGLVIFFVASLIDYKWIKYLALPFYFGATGLLIYTTFAGVEINGTRAWLDVGPMLIQTSQLAIAGGLILLAFILSTLHRLHPVLRNPFMRLMVSGIVALIPFGFVLLQGDFGSALVWLPVAGAMVLIGNIPFRYLIVIILAVTMFLPFAFFFGLKDYQKKRITTQIEMLQGKKVNVLAEATVLITICWRSVVGDGAERALRIRIRSTTKVSSLRIRRSMTSSFRCSRRSLVSAEVCS